MNFIEKLKIRAKECKMTIILPAVMDEIIFIATEKILKEDIAKNILIIK